jgi:Na+-transporting NADH:ubiquinone oxidoreductase subunit A
MKFKISKGLNLPITGGLSSQNVEATISSDLIAVIGSDFIGMKPTMLVKEGDVVQIGQPLFACKKNIGAIYTSPAAGTVIEINRGEKRVFQSVVIKKAGSESHFSFKSFSSKPINDYTTKEVQALLIESGEWTALRQRPFEKVAAVNGKPKSIFITAMDSNPHALDASEVIKSQADNFEAGVKVLSKLTDGKTYVCHEQGKSVPVPQGSNFQGVTFSGPHPSGNAGTHIHFVDSVTPSKYVWHINYQDVIAIGSLFKTGQLYLDRIISVAGPLVKKPQVIKTRRGAAVSEIVAGNLIESEPTRVISGSVLNGRIAEKTFNYLGRFHFQVSVIKEDHGREFLGWQSPGFNKFSVQRIYLSKLMPSKLFSLSSNKNGSFRAMVPIGSYEKVMPLDILPTQLLRALLSKDTDSAQDLGCLELAEEDMALLTFVDPGKTDFGPILRDNLSTIEKDG